MRSNSRFQRSLPALALMALVCASISRADDAAVVSPLDPDAAVRHLTVLEGLEVTLFAAEPMIASPTNLEVDHRGRVWVCEVINYHRNRGRRPEGDRILILEDSDDDGRADNVKVFYQGTDVDSAMGICVLGNRVIVTSSPRVLILEDTDGDDRADRKEILFSKTGDPEHDHSAHSFVFGPDGKLYWNFGNVGYSVHDRDGRPLIDVFGRRVVDDGKPYLGGMAFRCNVDGGQFEVLGHNFRNNYELTVDSFGTVWQSDNDDDGNRGARVNYVMEYGNYGYLDEMTGALWQTERTGWNDDVSKRHWHQNDPGSVPNFVVTGNGAPAGITVYEGRLLPENLRDQVIHGDTVTNVVYVDLATPGGAGYRGEAISLLRSPGDRWFRPVDVSTAPDGSVFVTDWYDPGVGGHRQADITRGRIYRVAPKGTPYRKPRYDFSTADGAVDALRSPSYATRYLAWTALHEMGNKAEPALLRLFGAENPRHRARALWLLGKIDGRGERYVARALTDADANIRIVGIRLTRQLGVDVLSTVEQVLHDPSRAVRREAAIALVVASEPRASDVWATLAAQHDGRDRWYLEALGIGATGRWEERFGAWRDRIDDRWNTPAGRDIIWRSRASRAMPLLAEIIRDRRTGPTERLRYFRAFDFHEHPSKNRVLTELTKAEHPDRDAITVLAVQHCDPSTLSEDAELRAAVDRALEASRDTPAFVSIVRRFSLRGRAEDLARYALEHSEDPAAEKAARMLEEWSELERFFRSTEDPDPTIRRQAIAVLGPIGSEETVSALEAIIVDTDRSDTERALAIVALGQRRNGCESLSRLVRSGAIPETLHVAAATVFLTSRGRRHAAEVAEYLKMPTVDRAEPLPPLEELVAIRGDATKGRDVFRRDERCSSCHVVGGEGKSVGPDLSTIGAKLGRVALFESILSPSLGISHGFEAYTVVTRRGEVVSGVLRERTDAVVTLIDADAVPRSFATRDVARLEKLETSLMPADLHQTLSAEELVDLVEHLTMLK